MNNIALYSSNIDNSFDYSQLLSLIFYFLAFILILVLAFFSTKLWARKSNFGMKSKNIEILDAMSMNNNNKILILKILNNVYIVSISNNSINLIDKLGDASIYYESYAKEESNTGFTSYLEKILRGSKEDRQEFTDEEETNKKLLNILNKVKISAQNKSKYTPIDEDEYKDEKKLNFHDK